MAAARDRVTAIVLMVWGLFLVTAFGLGTGGEDVLPVVIILYNLDEGLYVGAQETMDFLLSI
jgi:hypothetical protein